MLVSVPPPEAQVDAADEGRGLVHHDALLMVGPHLGSGDVVRVTNDSEGKLTVLQVSLEFIREKFETDMCWSAVRPRN